MNTAKQVGSYAQAQQSGETNRQTEARALLAAASRLAAAQEEGSSYDAYMDAIRHNQKLWTLFQVLLAEPENQLGQELKLTLARLSHHVDKISLRACTQYNPELLNDLISINRKLAAGLSVSPPQEEAK